MQHLTVFVIVCTLVASTYSGQPRDIENEDLTATQVCETPEWPFHRNTSDPGDKTDFLYIYNSTSRLCEVVYIDPTFRNHTYNSRFECVSKCNTGQGAPRCVGDPLDPCDDAASNDTDYYYYYDNTAYFYNATSEECQAYQACGNNANIELEANYYNSDLYCFFECAGFNISNVCGSDRTNEDV